MGQNTSELKEARPTKRKGEQVLLHSSRKTRRPHPHESKLTS